MFRGLCPQIGDEWSFYPIEMLDYLIERINDFNKKNYLVILERFQYSRNNFINGIYYKFAIYYVNIFLKHEVN